ncbi:MAG: hypothetical protein KDA33_09345, partial [Phycisphaerales bacterium]|nr:hypothetical protein [Phycisphaerales bacterium]
VARRPDGPTFATTFLVQTYQLPKAYLSFDIPERVILRGQPIKGAIVAKYNYGEPVRDREIEYVLMGVDGTELHRVGRTDDKGRLEFEFESRSMPEQGEVSLFAIQAELELDATDSVVIATRTFSAKVEVSRSLFLADEPVEVTVTSVDLKDKPVSRAMSVTAYRRTRDAGEWAETKMASADVTTDEKTGKGRVSLKLTKGGPYTIRAEGLDTLGNTVTAACAVTISDEDDKTRLRMFSDRQHYKVGETLALDVHSRIEPCRDAPASARSPLALLTFEGDGFLSYRTVRIDKGHNEIEIPIEHAHFPNFRVAAGVMDTRKLYDTSRDFTVERRLNVTLTPDKESYRPRDEMAVEVAVTDHQGKPVSAEFELTMVDHALLVRYPDATPNIVEFFQSGAKRVTSSRVQSSCEFHYSARTRDMVTEILDENQRIVEAALFDGFVTAGSGIERLGSVNLIAPAPQTASRSFDMDDDGVLDEKSAAAREPREARLGGRRRGMAARKPSRMAQGLAKKDKVAAPAGGGIGGGGAKLGEDFVGYGDEESEWSYPASESAPAPNPRDALRMIEAKVAVHNKLNFARYEAPSLAATDRKLASIVSAAPPRTYFPELAYWNPRIVTDATGKATVSIVVPDSSTKWRLMARGVTGDTLCGQTSVDVTSRHDFFVEILAPDALVEGDQFVPAAQAHCLTDYHGDVRVSLTWSVDGDEDK